MARRWLEREAPVAVALAAVLVVADVAGALAPTDVRVPDGGFSLGVVALSLASAAPLWWRRRRPLLVLAGLLGAAGICAAALPPGLLSQRSGATVVVGVYAVASWSEHRRWAVVVPAALAALLLAGGIDDGATIGDATAAAAAAVALPWALGVAARSRRAEVAEIRNRLEAAERDRDATARRAVVEERAHIARELHDVVAHHVSLIGVQAGAARTALDVDPSATREALGRIESSSRQVVGEMRHLLDALRDDEPTGPGVVIGGRATAPAPGLGALDALLAGFRAAGLDVEVVGSVPLGLGDALDLTCYRLVEEALTNVARHSTARCATVAFGGDATEVRLAVTDPGPARAQVVGAGRGRVGMSERVALFGGTLHDGPLVDGGWRVAATLRRDGGRT